MSDNIKYQFTATQAIRDFVNQVNLSVWDECHRIPSRTAYAIAEKMVNSMLRIPLFERGERPVVFVSSVKNKTMEHIDTKGVTDKIRTAMIKSGKVRFTATSDIPTEILDQLEYQRGSGLVDPRTRKEYGKQIGADYILYGEIGSIVKRAGRRKDVYYKITLNLVDIQTAIIEWADEKEIRKTQKKPILGL